MSYTLQSGETIKLQSVSQPTEADSTTYQTVWQLTDEPDAALDTDKTDALLAALASYVTGQNTAADLSACGFDAPLVTTEVTTADDTVTLTYAIGTDGYYMMVSGNSSVYTVDGPDRAGPLPDGPAAESRHLRIYPKSTRSSAL